MNIGLLLKKIDYILGIKIFQIPIFLNTFLIIFQEIKFYYKT